MEGSVCGCGVRMCGVDGSVCGCGMEEGVYVGVMCGGGSLCGCDVWRRECIWVW